MEKAPFQSQGKICLCDAHSQLLGRLDRLEVARTAWTPRIGCFEEQPLLCGFCAITAVCDTKETSRYSPRNVPSIFTTTVKLSNTVNVKQIIYCKHDAPPIMYIPPRSEAA